jgi:hypothetical protein
VSQFSICCTGARVTASLFKYIHALKILHEQQLHREPSVHFKEPCVTSNIIKTRKTGVKEHAFVYDGDAARRPRLKTPNDLGACFAVNNEEPLAFVCFNHGF